MSDLKENALKLTAYKRKLKTKASNNVEVNKSPVRLTKELIDKMSSSLKPRVSTAPRKIIVIPTKPSNRIGSASKADRSARSNTNFPKRCASVPPHHSPEPVVIKKRTKDKHQNDRPPRMEENKALMCPIVITRNSTNAEGVLSTQLKFKTVSDKDSAAVRNKVMQEISVDSAIPNMCSPAKEIKRSIGMHRKPLQVPLVQPTLTSISNGPVAMKNLTLWNSNDNSKNSNDLQKYTRIVQRAINQHKIFTVSGGYRGVRHALESRGWIEKVNVNGSGLNENLYRQLCRLSLHELMLGMSDKEMGITCRRMLFSRLLASHPADFYWDYNRQHRPIREHVIVNCIPHGIFNFTNKRGLCESSKNSYWFHNPGKSHLNHPRSYTISHGREISDFVADFRITACASLLKWITEVSRNNQSKLVSDCGTIPISVFQFVLTECAKLLKRLKHIDIDQQIPEAPDGEWNTLLDYFSKAVHMGNHFKSSSSETETTVLQKAKMVLAQLQKKWPYCDMDGYMNIWILKPACGSRGIGIHICRTLQYILKILDQNKASTYVVQKYIERPFLIFNTKFDIRQWFLISKTYPLTIWIYKECYLRFSSQTYNLRKLHESIHLTNNSIQSRYVNALRDPALPEYNMWYLPEFKTHLKRIGYASAFDEIIYPGMKECITAAILLNQGKLMKRPNAFELHGADFMLTEDFKPWLIEINSRPALYNSTPVTAKLCPQVLEDVIKVVIDLRHNPKASTGGFELLYAETVEQLPEVDSNSLLIEGTSISTSYFQASQPDLDDKRLGDDTISEVVDLSNNKTFLTEVSKQVRGALEKLLGLIQEEKQRRLIQAAIHDKLRIGYKDEQTQIEELLRLEKLSQTEKDRNSKDIDTNTEDLSSYQKVNGPWFASVSELELEENAYTYEESDDNDLTDTTTDGDNTTESGILRGFMKMLLPSSRNE